MTNREGFIRQWDIKFNPKQYLIIWDDLSHYKHVDRTKGLVKGKLQSNYIILELIYL